MLFYFLALITLYWFALAFWCYTNLKKTFKRYKNTPRLQVPEHYRAFLRTDFGRWDEKALLRRAFTQFPLRVTAIVSALSIYALLGTLNRMFKFPPVFLIKLYRKFYGKNVMRILLNIKQNFDPNEKIVTPIVMANHSTGMDILYIGFCISSIISFVAKKEIDKIPVIRDLAEFLQSILLDRSSAEARAKVKTDIDERVKMFEKDSQNVFPLLIFPEGTVSNGRSLMQFKNGAFQPLAPITIFCLRYQSKQFSFGDNELAGLDHFILSLCANGDLIVSKKIMYPVTNETVESYRERCRQQLSKMGDFKMYDCSYRDYLQYDKLFKAKLAEIKAQTKLEQPS